MEIRLPYAEPWLDKHIELAASNAGCVARLKWHRADQARFILVDRPMSDTPASFAAHDKVIRQLLEKHPDAHVRTAKAIYQGLQDFHAQKAGALS